MPLWIGLYLPTHSLDALFPHWPTRTPVAAVLRKEQVNACTPAAQALGVKTGMWRGTARGIAPDILFGDYSRAAEQHYLQQVALGLLRYTPNLALFGDHALVLEVGASLLLFKGPRCLWRQLLVTTKSLGLNARLGMAPTAQGAWIMARQIQSRQRRALQIKSLRRRLDPLPITMLPAACAHVDWLQAIGCHTLKQLNNLPRAGLQQRSSPLLVQALDAAYGGIDNYFAWFEAPDFFSQRIDLVERLEHAQAVEFAAKRLIEQLCGWLQARCVAVDTLFFNLHHEKGRHARPPSCIVLRFSQPSWLPGDFARILAEQLRRTTLNAPVIAIELSIADTTPRPAASQSLFPDPSQWLTKERHVLDLLRARLGPTRVLYAQPQADYRPECANRWGPLKADLPSASSAPPQMPACSRPFWLLPVPLTLATHNDHPVYNGVALHLIQGPERVESGWWTESGHELRDYFIAQDRHNARYWIYRQRESLQAHWFLHGLFG
ncbi:MAG: DNA polymerase Y family protein [Burkholderiaceae bacterium]